MLDMPSLLSHMLGLSPRLSAKYTKAHVRAVIKGPVAPDSNLTAFFLLLPIAGFRMLIVASLTALGTQNEHAHEKPKLPKHVS